MSTWFECKVKYEKIGADGKEKMVTENYLVDAISFTEAESRINKELEPYISGEFVVTNIKIANFAELVPNDNGDRWFKCKVTFISLDEEKGIERRSNNYMLVQANNVKEAFDNLQKALGDTISTFEIPAIQESPLMDVFTYFEDELENKKKRQNLNPAENSDKAEFEEDEDE
ncbi:MAG: DUF4494 domain-containing protein [Salinivirgaceae bacterium]